MFSLVQSPHMKTLLTVFFSFISSIILSQDYLKQGDACYTQKNFSCAYDNYMKGYEANLPATKNILYFRVGYCLNNMKRYEEAKVWFWRALKEKTELDPTWSLAFAHYSTFKYDSAAIYYVRAYGLAITNEHKKNTSYYAGLSYFLGKNYTAALTQFSASLKLDSTDLSTQTYVARTHFSVKNYTAAETEFKKLLAISKDSGSISYAYKMIGESIYSQRRYTMAIPLYRTAMQYNPKDRQLIGYIGDCYLNLSKYDSARLTYQQAIDQTKSLKNQFLTDSIFIGSMNRGLLSTYINEKDTTNAVRKLADIIKYDVENEEITNLLNLLVIKRKDVKSLEAMMPSLITGYKLYKMKPELAWLYNNAAMVYEQLNQQSKAMNYYRLAVQANYLPTDYIGAGFIRSLIKEKKYKEATDSINAWEKVPNQYPSLYKPFFLNMRGRIAYAQNDTATAAKYFKEVIKSNYTSTDANLFLGRMAIDRKDSTNAFGYWSRISGANNFVTEQDMAMQVYRFIGVRNFETASKNPNYGYSSYTTASEVFDKIFAIDSNIALIRLYAGITHLQLKRVYTGKMHLLKAADLYQKKKDSLAIVYRWLGFAEMRGETIPNYTKAFDYYQKGMQANPSDSAVVNDLATAYYQQKDYTKAAEIFGKSVNTYKSIGNKAVAYYNKALSYYMNKQKAESMAEVNKSLELNPQYADAKKLKAELEKPTQ
jgi:tetratricopeptide (TPR) repeat protein